MSEFQSAVGKALDTMGLPGSSKAVDAILFAVAELDYQIKLAEQQNPPVEATEGLQVAKDLLQAFRSCADQITAAGKRSLERIKQCQN